MKKTLSLLFGALALVVTAPVPATTIVAMDADALAAQSELIFVGQVVGVESLPTSDRSFAFTHVTFAVAETLKGSVAKELFTLRLAGGHLGDQVVEVVGMPTFVIGERYVVFASGNGTVGCPVLGWSQGLLRFVPHPTRAGDTVLVDGVNRLVVGVSEGQFQHSGHRLEHDGWRAIGPVADPSGVTILWQEGVEVTHQDSTQRSPEPLAEAQSAEKTLAELRDLVKSTRLKKGAHPGLAMPSAESFEIPTTFTLRPTRAQNR